MRKVLWMAVAAGVVFGMTNWAVAADDYTIERLKREFRSLREEVRMLRAEKMDAKLSNAQRDEIVKLCAELNEDCSARGSGPSWLQDFTIFGDLRLRYHGTHLNGNWSSHGKERNRARFRLRLGVKKTWWDKQMEVGFKLASGSAGAADGAALGSDGTSANQTFDDWFSQKPIWIDQAYAKFKPNAVPGLTIIGGKMSNPLVFTDMVWDHDVNPEGFWAQYKPKFGGFSPFVSVGYWLLGEDIRDAERAATGVFGGSRHDAIMISYQAGFDLQIDKDWKATFAATYYDYDHYDVGAPDSRYSLSPGDNRNTLNHLGNYEDAQIINLTAKLKGKVAGIPLAMYFDWAHNCGENFNPYMQPPLMPNPSGNASPLFPGSLDYKNQSDAWAFGLKVGENKKKGDWSVSYKYAHIEANSVPSFNDSDFGYNNLEGHVIGAKYNIDTFLTIGAKVYTTTPIAGPTDSHRTTTVLVDLIWKF